jgi:hypothetical protein
VATVTFGALAGAGFLVLPQASWQWWFGADFLARRCIPAPAVPRRSAPPPGVQYLIAQSRKAPPRADWPRAGSEDHRSRRPISLVE